MNLKTTTATIYAIIILLATSQVIASSHSIRVGLTSFGGASVQIRSNCPLVITKTDSSENLMTGKISDLSVSADNKCIKLTSGKTSTESAASITIKPADTSCCLSLTSASKLTRKYRGSIEITLNAGTLRVINIVDLEDYLQGVVSAEMPDRYPEEALKAQAISARTYTLSNLRRHSSKGFNLCDSTDCQSYIGITEDKPKCVKAVKDTSGQVLLFEGEPVAAFYSTDCGGATRDYTEVNPSFRAPYLSGVVDPEGIKRIIWQQAYKLTDLEKKLLNAGIKEAEGLEEISVAKTGSTGWVLEVSVKGKQASTCITASRLQQILTKSVMKSTFFTIDKLTVAEVLIKGKGWGHGLGLCQTGAKALAQPPHNFSHEKILAHYFPGTQIAQYLPAAPAEMAMAAKSSAKPVSRTKQKPALAPAEPQQLPFDVRLHVPETP